MGRQKGSKNKHKTQKSCPPPKGLRLRYYENAFASNGEIISGTADQFGRVMKTFKDEKGYLDIGPTGISIAATH